MDAHLFRRFCEDLTPLLIGARVEKIQEPSDGLLALMVYSGGRKRQLCLRFGRKEPFCFVTSQRISVGRAPSAPIMRLRKYATGRRIVACVARWSERCLWLLLAGGAEAPQLPPLPQMGQADAGSEQSPRLTWLLLDLREGPSLRFLAENESPEDEQATWPEPAQLADALNNWRQWPVLTPALRRTLACLEEPEQWALLEDLRTGGGDIFCYGPCAPASGNASAPAMPRPVLAISAWPLPPEQQRALQGKNADAPSTAEFYGPEALNLTELAGQDMVLARLALDQAREAAQPLDRRTRKLAKLLEKLREEENRLGKMMACQADALALQAELWRWPADFRAACVTVEEGPHGPAREIPLDLRYSVRDQMARLFHTARRGQRGMEHLAVRRGALEDELASLRQARHDSLLGATAGAGDEAAPTGRAVGTGMAATLPKNVQMFISSDGFVLLRGRDSKGNLAARKLAAPHDIWLHAENGPGSHVIIRRAHGGQEVPPRTLDEAGALAACKSWQRDAARARIQYAEVRHVKPMRNAPAGTVRIDKSLPSREVPVDLALEETLLPR
ncbi:NFACT RNA binding domain-containing protein [uncultured Desulfovibrio sp.]|uniref:NFACT RNA binding domain-containing protein n=1 Tax=uncultured Desulfovibrio sp. TaxID=167968 RepID=UPI002633B95C|nr:NFACT RNA binding domain-containing protein [uncultured Desulfovibrio sp.]